jgi:molecular chaperone GrpE
VTGEPKHSADEPVVRDKRRIDPVTGQVRRPAAGTGSQAASAATPAAPSGTEPAAKAGSVPGNAAPVDELADVEGLVRQLAQEVETLRVRLAERTTDLQRLQAEYANYRRRVERDRLVVREIAMSSVLAELLPALDDIGRARDHGELEGGFKSVAESLESTVAKLGLMRFGEKGEAFDPTVHEALMHRYSTEVKEPTCVEILRPGYRVGDRVIRPAQVTVAEPDPDAEGLVGDDPGQPSQSDQLSQLGQPDPSEHLDQS